MKGEYNPTWAKSGDSEMRLAEWTRLALLPQTTCRI